MALEHDRPLAASTLHLGAAGLLCLVLQASCSNPSTSLLIEIETAGELPTSLAVVVFGPEKVLIAERKISGPIALPGRIVVHGLPERAQSVRIVVAGEASQPLLGSARVDTVPRRQVPVSVLLRPDTADLDDDRVPDEIDNCPATKNPDQHDLEGDGTGDACADDPPDLSEVPDLSTPGDPCFILPSALDPTALLARCVVGSPPTIDGDLADWATVAFSPRLTHGSAADQGGSFSGTPANDDQNCSGELAARWDSSFLYVAVRVFDNVRGGTPTGTAYYNQDAVELFLDGAGDRMGPYGVDDFQFIVRYDGAGQPWRQGGLVGGLPTGVVTAATTGPNGTNWVLEMAIPWSLVDASTGAVASAGRLLGFNWMLEDNDNPAAEESTHYLVWQRTVATGCTTCDPTTCRSTCSTRPFGLLQLAGR